MGNSSKSLKINLAPVELCHASKQFIPKLKVVAQLNDKIEVDDKTDSIDISTCNYFLKEKTGNPVTDSRLFFKISGKKKAREQVGGCVSKPKLMSMLR